jgi:hypothetical protein
MLVDSCVGLACFKIVQNMLIDSCVGSVGFKIV